MDRLTKRDWKIIGDALEFIIAGENPFDEEGTDDPITVAELEAAARKVAQRERA